mgnify:CR=1 FL=1
MKKSKDNSYPIIWWIEGQNVIMQDKNGETIKEEDSIYKAEIDFIKNEISEILQNVIKLFYTRDQLMILKIVNR